MTIHVTGGFYYERCIRPSWDEAYGSGGRAAVVIATCGSDVVFHTYTSDNSAKHLQMYTHMFGKLTTHTASIDKAVSFYYLHDLGDPQIDHVPTTPSAPLQVRGKHVVRFGMLEGDAIVDADWAVYDPQNQGAPVPFDANGSKAKHLALVLNSWEARQMAALTEGSAQQCAEKIAREQNAEVVIIKQGAQGALVWTASGTSQVPAYRTANVWKIGSGDCFVAYFAQAWMEDGLAPALAADRASRATAYYCETQGFATLQQIEHAKHAPIMCKTIEQSANKMVYLAGPFFHLGQIWIIEQARTLLKSAGLNVFSPFHDIGLGSASDVVQKDIDAIKKCDLMFAIADGLDPGTIFEIGYARSINKPVVIYSELHSGEEALKMMDGTACDIYQNFTTSIYATRWKAVET
ncbi:nucleoside 2-deoxyribosyltransferase [Acidovorax sp. SUPP2522]|uniref:PfkB family carbohydrate kinase n=1 Tax=unclassified Acidovorax TaxID=2684926 RepID=UPI00234BF0E7|nr:MULTISPECIES: PfkB family carbohydrate kinase [unclassified Acidovorax]WCM97586.1 PfkB family carbohydrate kinase [Acidovorax sp. GBBC 1281]GKT18915.1 nucleoside 2-deoxyribosyltransferase [Acidovorax sp. SUPP2522]